MRDVSNTRYRQMTHYCERDHYVLLNFGFPSVVLGFLARPPSPFTVTPRHPSKGEKKRDLRSLDYHARLIGRDRQNPIKDPGIGQL